MANRSKNTPEKRAAFLEALEQTASVTKACELTNLTRRTVYDWKLANPEFAAQWETAVEVGTDALEDEAIRRAKDGTKKPVYQGKELVGYIQEYSDTLLIFMLKARRPEKYRDRYEVKTTTTVTHGFDLKNLDDEQLGTLRGILAQAVAGGIGEPEGRC